MTWSLSRNRGPQTAEAEHEPNTHDQAQAPAAAETAGGPGGRSTRPGRRVGKGGWRREEQSWDQTVMRAAGNRAGAGGIAGGEAGGTPRAPPPPAQRPPPPG